MPKRDTRGGVVQDLRRTQTNYYVRFKEEPTMATMAKEMIRIRLKAYDHQLID